MKPERELELLRGLLSLAFEKERVSLMGQNEFHRKTIEVAEKLEATAEEIREIFVPLVTRRFEAMIAPMPEKSARRKPGLPFPGGPFDDASPKE